MGPNARKWIESFLKNRAQYVKIRTAQSRWRTVTCGVPQGSVIGPLLYATYVNDMSEAIKNPECKSEEHENNDDLFGTQCNKCGKLITYADDSTYHVSNKKREDNKLKIDNAVLKLQQYMNNNELCMNVGKTTVTEMMIKQKKGRTKGDPPKIIVQTGPGTQKEITDKGRCKILGATLQANITWNLHLDKEKNSLFPTLRKLLGSLKHQGKKIPKKCRKVLATGLIHSKLSYLLPLWGGSQGNLTRKAQGILNKAARWATGLPRKTRTTVLMRETNWLSIREMTYQHGAVLMWKILHTRRPLQMYRRMTIKDDWSLDTKEPRLQFTTRTYRHQATKNWNEIPEAIRTISTVSSFKRALKTWIKGRRSQEPD